MRLEDRPVGNRAHAVAVPVARGVAGVDQVDAAQTDDEEHDRDQHAEADPLEETEHGDGQEHQGDDEVVGTGDAFADLDEPVVDHDDAGEQNHASHQGYRHEAEQGIAHQQRRADRQRGHDPGQPQVDPEHQAAHARRNDHAAGRSAAQSGKHAGVSHGAELPVPVQFAVGGEFEAADVHDDAQQGDQNQRQHVGNLPGNGGPTDQRQVVGTEGGPQVALGKAGEQESGRRRLGAGNVEEREAEMEQHGGADEADGHQQKAAPTLGRQVQGDAVADAEAPVRHHEGLKQRGEHLPLQSHPP